MNTSVEIKNLVDELGLLNTKLTTFDELVSRRETIRKQLSEYADTFSDSEVNIQGSSFIATFSKAPVTRELKVEQYPAYLEAVGINGFLQSVKVSVTTATKLLGQADQERLFSTSKGARRLKGVVEIPRVVSAEDPTTAFYASLAGIIDGLTPRASGPSH